MKNSCLQKYEDMNLLRETNKTQKHNFEKKIHEFYHPIIFLFKKNKQKKCIELV